MTSTSISTKAGAINKIKQYDNIEKLSTSFNRSLAVRSKTEENGMP